MKAGLIPEGRFHSWSQVSFLGAFTKVFFSGLVRIFRGSIVVLAVPKYPDTSPSHPGLPQSYPNPQIPSIHPSNRVFPAAPACQSPTKGLDILIFDIFRSIYRSRQTPQPSLLIIPPHLSILQTPEDERWEQSQAWMHQEAAPWGCTAPWVLLAIKPCPPGKQRGGEPWIKEM